MRKKEILFEKIKKEILNCRKCNLFRERKNPVPGEGSLEAKIFFVGEAPGKNEDEKGKPFCGMAGKVLDRLLSSISLKREEVFIGNLIKCRPPKNRDPKKEEILACSPYLEKQLEIIKPKIICPLGRHSMKFIMEKFNLKNEIKPISEIHGKIFKGRSLFLSPFIVPLYHPAFCLYNPQMEKILEEDFKKLSFLLKKI